MKIPIHLLKNLNDNAAGRLRLKLFKEITKKENVYPSNKETIRYIESINNNHYAIAELFTYILTDGSTYKATFSDLPTVQNHDELNTLLQNLDTFPQQDPALYEIKDVNNSKKNLLVWIKCEKLENSNGHFYIIILLDEDHFPKELAFYVEIRSCQEQPNPAIIYSNGSNQTIQLNRDDSRIFKNDMIGICLSILTHLFYSPHDSLIPIEKTSMLSSKIQSCNPPPEDTTYNALLENLIKGNAKCYTAIIDMDLIIPYSYHYCFNIPFNLISAIEKRNFNKKIQSLAVYPKNNKYIMSDDYITYMILRKRNIKRAKAIIISKSKPQAVQILATGGIELLPPLRIIHFNNYDSLDYEINEHLLQKHIEHLIAFDNFKSTWRSKCVVLTEDTDTKLLENLLIANGFNLDQTILLSYKNSTNLGNLELTTQTLKNTYPFASILIHRDLDYLPDKEVETIKSRIEKYNATPFITDGTDIESYYLNEHHIHILYPTIPFKKIQELLMQATNSLKQESIELIKKQEFGERYKNKNTHLDLFLEDLFNNNPNRYRHGKKTLKAFISLLQKELKQNINILKPTEALKNSLLMQIKDSIW